MTPKQQRFVEEYLVDLNASAAARRAGYSAKTAEWQGPQLLGKSHVSQAVQAALKARSERTQINSDWVLRTLAEEKTADIADLYDANGNLRPAKDWPIVWRRGLVVGVESVEEFERDADGNRVSIGMVRKVKLTDRIKHIELIGRHVNVQAFREQIGHGGPNGGPIPVVATVATPEEFKRIAAEMAAKV